MAQEENSVIAENRVAVDGKGHDNKHHPAMISHERGMQAADHQLLDILTPDEAEIPKNFTAIVAAKLKQLRGQ